MLPVAVKQFDFPAILSQRDIARLIGQNYASAEIALYVEIFQNVRM